MFRCSCVPVFGCSGVQVFVRVVPVGTLVHWYAGRFAHWAVHRGNFVSGFQSFRVSEFQGFIFS